MKSERRKVISGLLILVSAVLIFAAIRYGMPRRITFSDLVTPEKADFPEPNERGAAAVEYDLELRRYLFRPDTLRGTITVDGVGYVSTDDPPAKSLEPITVQNISDKFTDTGRRLFRLASLDGTPDAVGTRFVQYDFVEAILSGGEIVIYLHEKTPESRVTAYRTCYR
jgi:hypothetical protein